MKNGLFKKELINLLILFFAVVAILKILFYKESNWVIVKVAAGIFWLFVIPGFFVMHYWSEKLGFLERLVAGIVVSAAVLGIFSYYLGLLGLHVKYHYIVIPPVMMLIGILMIFMGKKDMAVGLEK